MLELEERATVAARLFCNSEERESQKNQIWFWRFDSFPAFPSLFEPSVLFWS
jgi:hypothetical protein